MTDEARSLMFDSMWPGDDLAGLAPIPVPVSAPVPVPPPAPKVIDRPVERTSERERSKDSPQPCLISVGVTGETRIFPLADESVIGREPGATIYFPSDDVSRRHARIVRGPDGSYAIEDLRSVNGTFVNGRPVSRSVLVFGDKISVGQRIVLFFARQPR